MKCSVTGLRGRLDGWTVDRQRLFLGVLAETGSVSRAVEGTGLSRASLYKLLRRPGAAAFDSALRNAHADFKARATRIAPRHIRTVGGGVATRTVSAGPPRFNASSYIAGPPVAPRKIVNFRPSGNAGDDRSEGAILSTSGHAPLAPAPGVL